MAILDEAFAAIATATANTEKNLANARELFESGLHHLFDGLPTGTPAMPLAQVCQKITVGHVGSMASRYVESGIPFLRSKNVRPFEISYADLVYIDEGFHNSLRKSSLGPGDLVIVRTGYPGTAAVIPPTMPVANCSDLVVVRPRLGVTPDYLCLFFNSTFGKESVGTRLVGAAQKHFNVTEAKRTNVPIPSPEKQAEVVWQANRLSEASRELAQTYQQKVARLAELKQSLLHRAFTGQLTAGPRQLEFDLA